MIRVSIFRRKNFKKITDNNVKNKQQVADCKTLPPTDDAALFHSLRVYHQASYSLLHSRLPIISILFFYFQKNYCKNNATNNASYHLNFTIYFYFTGADMDRK